MSIERKKVVPDKTTAAIKYRRKYIKRKKAIEKEEVSRRLFFKGSAIGLLGLAAYLLERKFDFIKSHTSGAEFTEVFEYYPSLANRTVNEVTTFGNNTVFNFSDGKFNPEQAGNILEFNRQLAESGKLNFSYPYKNEVITFTSKPRNIKDGLLFIIPIDAPYPYWVVGKYPNGQPPLAVTNTGLDELISYIRVPNKPAGKTMNLNNIALANNAIMTELCHWGVSVSTNFGQVEGVEMLGQEIVCNTLGKAFEERLIGKSHSQYLEIIKEENFEFAKLSPSPQISLSEDTYYSLQNSEAITFK